jgi:hypothetical protein|tara:strand:- start:67 stop:663 length:597 start_codon:yes stop_codon:yes gene_type:complete
MNKKERKVIAISITAILILFLGLIVYLFVSNNEGCIAIGHASNFEECIALGCPAMESYPRQCMVNGETFVEEIPSWKTDGIALMQNSETGEFACFGCNTPNNGPAMCIDPVQIMKPVEETSEKYCNEDFEIIEDEKTFCSDASRDVDACIALYEPVCGWDDPDKIKCFKFPCASTYSNSCNACKNPNVLYWTSGDCPE